MTIALVRRTLLAIVATIGAGAVNATSFDVAEARRIEKQLFADIARPMPTAGDVLGAEPQRPAQGFVAISNPLPVEQGKCDSEAASRALGTVLRIEMWGLSKSIGFIPPMSYWQVTEPLSSAGNASASERMVERMGPRWLVAGTIDRQREGFKVELSVEDRQGRVAQTSIHKAIQNETANKDIADLAIEILRAMQLEPESSERPRLEYFREFPSAAFAALVHAFEGNCDGDGDFFERLTAAWKKFPSYASLAVHYQNDSYKPDRAARRAELKHIAALAGANPVVRIHTSWRLAFNSPRSEGVEDIPALKEVASRYPHEPLAWYSVANALSSFNLLYADQEEANGRTAVTGAPEDHPRAYAHSIALASRSTELWPESYMGWLELATALNSYHQGIRGTCGWSCVPAGAKARLPALEQVFDRVVARGLAAYSESGPLLAAKLVADKGTGGDWWSSFLLGVRLRPHYYHIYQKAMIYSGDAWGGSAAMRREVYQTAKANNPGEDWPVNLYTDYAPWSETLWARFGAIVWTILGLMIVALAVWKYRQNRDRA